MKKILILLCVFVQVLIGLPAASARVTAGVLKKHEQTPDIGFMLKSGTSTYRLPKTFVVLMPAMIAAFCGDINVLRGKEKPLSL